MAFKVEIKGLRELEARLKQLPNEVHGKADAIVETGAKEWVRQSKRLAPVDHGFLKNGISYARNSTKDRISYMIVSNAHYSPYLEWGTITKVSVPADQSGYAMQFKGKGLRQNGGIIPHPFFFPPQIPVKNFIERMIKAMSKDLKL